MPEETKVPINPEIAEALLEFDRREEARQMPAREDNTNTLPGMVASLIKHSRGSIKNQKQAEYILIFFIVVCLLISAYLFAAMSSLSNETPPAFINKPYLPLK